MWLYGTESGGCRFQVPAMSGLGGNLVLFLPSGLIAIRFTDADNYQITTMVNAAEHYRSSCR
jgi:hypothetical protein